MTTSFPQTLNACPSLLPISLGFVATSTAGELGTTGGRTGVGAVSVRAEGMFPVHCSHGPVTAAGNRFAFHPRGPLGVVARGLRSR